MSEGQGPVPRAFRSGFGRCFLQRREAEGAARPVDGLFIPATIRQAESERKLAGWLCGIWTLLASAVWWFTGNEGSGMHMALRGLLFPLVWFVLLQLSILSCSLLAVPPYLLGWIRSKTAALVAERALIIGFTLLAFTFWQQPSAVAKGVACYWLTLVAVELICRCWCGMQAVFRSPSTEKGSTDG